MSYKQWVKKVVKYSSQYDKDDYSAKQVIGSPKVYPRHGDLKGTWAQSSWECDEDQFIEVKFDVKVRPTAINIYETFNPGAVVAVRAKDKNGAWEVLWSTDKPEHLQKSRIFSPTLKNVTTRTQVIRLELDCTAADTYCEIDAVELVGDKHGGGDDDTHKQWVKKVVKYSSQYNDDGWSANQVIGKPNVYPNHGDLHGAWATRETDQNQFIEVKFAVKVRPTAINIYETYNPGAVVAVRAKDKGSWEALWSTNKPEHLQESRIFSPTLKDVSMRTRVLRLELDCTAAGTWCEIDAVELLGDRDEDEESDDSSSDDDDDEKKKKKKKKSSKKDKSSTCVLL